LSDTPFRVLPRLDDETGFFWTSGKDGKLRVLRCDACRYLVHPPAPVCPQCLGRSLSPDALSGRGTVATYTVNHHPWDGSTEPWVVALVELEEQPDVRLMTNIVGIEPDEVAIGMPVQVVFEDHDPVFVPLFEPAR
jgi:uncharacterized OB-fold protein